MERYLVSVGIDYRKSIFCGNITHGFYLSLTLQTITEKIPKIITLAPERIYEIFI